MMWAIRRQYSGEVEYCLPLSCWPVAASYRRNSALSRPSACRVMRPVTSAWALMVFQFWNCGALSMSVIRSMKAAGSIGANNPLRLRLLVMTWVTPALTSASPGVPATKFVIAIGSGAASPPVTEMRACPNARCAPANTRPLDASPDRTCRRSMRKVVFVGSSGLDITFVPSARGALQVSAIENRIEEFPFVKETRGQPIWGAVDNRAQSALLEHTLERGARRRPRHRHGFERPVLLQLNAEFGLDPLRLGVAERLLPAAQDLLLEHRAPGRGIVRRLALGEPERGIGVQRLARDRLPRRIALVDQRRDGFAIELVLPLLDRWRRRRRLGLGLWRRLLGFVLLQGFGDRIDLWLLGFFLGRLCLFLWLVLGNRLRRVGLLLNRLLRRFRRRIGRGVGHHRLVGDLADGVVHRLGFGNLLHQWLRVRLGAGFDAGRDLGELIGGNDIDRQGFFGNSLEGLGRKRHQSPPEHEDVQGYRRNECLVDLHCLKTPAPLR